MAANIEKIARLLGAEIVDQVPDTGPGFLGASRMADEVSRIRMNRAANLANSDSPSTTGDQSPIQLPISELLLEKLEQLAKKTHGDNCGVSPIQFATQLLEDAVDRRLGT